MHPSSTSTNLLQKYFPDLCLSSQTTEDFFYSGFSVTAFSSAILQTTHVGKTHVFVNFDLFSNLPYIHFSGRWSRGHLSFANVGQLATLEADSGCRMEDEGEEGGGGERSYNGQAALKGKDSRGRNSWNEMPKFLLAGAVSTIVSRTFVAPLERIKLECIIQGSKYTWFRTIQSIWAREGLMGFWKGNVLNLFRMVPFKCINFISYDMYCARLLRVRGAKEITNHDRLIAGGISGITATILCLPLDTIRTRLLAPGGEALGGVVGCYLHMIHNEGFLSLYKGLTPALISMGPSCAVFYAIYDILKTSHLSHINKNGSYGEMGEERELSVVRALLYGAIAGACAETATYPLEVIRRQLQLHQAKRVGLVTVFVKLVQREGVGSLFAGLAPSTLQKGSFNPSGEDYKDKGGEWEVHKGLSMS
ncbi:putative mitochondrial adenine nucleotide transporter BTL3 [Cinnamomum micranthum f. kanehirae]|uniref:Putative mitochondrial adenine nucleotide transporter BTL3 n=1 Tax=Cinnamomum micranthum f. kanehirae TaxID=337451 RepID=A0A3S3LY76_9MAGN|nr:putative mitochondrial adenine nucleotide transporter BTL3 [Cinnamomum micranthum f. kanehirae]